MQERQVTIDGQSYPLDAPFLVVATQNPIELEGTYPLPEAQLDRFLIRVAVGYPEAEEEREVLRRRRERRQEGAALATIVPHDVLLAMQAGLEDVYVDGTIDEYIVNLVRATRTDNRVALGASPRGALALQSIARAEAALQGRDFVTPDDVKAMAVPVLAHRIVLRPELWVARVSPLEVVDEVLKRVPTPKADAA
jgi:MoxR-like ATPase